MTNVILEYNSRCFVRHLVNSGKSEEEIKEELLEYDDFRDMPKALRYRTAAYAQELIEYRDRRLK